MLEEVANCVLALTPFFVSADCYGTRPGGALSRTGSGETWTIACSGGVQQQAHSPGSAMFCLTLRPGRKRIGRGF